MASEKCFVFFFFWKIHDFVNIKIKIVYFLTAPHSKACKIISAAAHENNTLGKTWGHSVIQVTCIKLCAATMAMVC